MKLKLKQIGKMAAMKLGVALILTPSFARAQEGARGAAEAQRIAVLPFETSNPEADGTVAGDLFGTYLIKSYPGVALVERERIQQILGELNLEHKDGIVDPETAGKLRSILGVDALVIGRVVAVGRDDNGRGTMMMTARLVNTSSGRVLWADSATVSTRQGALRRVLAFIDPPKENAALVTNRLLELASKRLVEGLGSVFADMPAASASPQAAPAALAAAPEAVRAPAPEAFAAPAPQAPRVCSVNVAEESRLGESVLPLEALYWAHRLREDASVKLNPGGGYSDANLRRRLNEGVMLWLAKPELPQLGARELATLLVTKEKISRLDSECMLGSNADRSPAGELVAMRTQGR